MLWAFLVSRRLSKNLWRWLIQQRCILDKVRQNVLNVKPEMQTYNVVICAQLWAIVRGPHKCHTDHIACRGYAQGIEVHKWRILVIYAWIISVWEVKRFLVIFSNLWKRCSTQIMFPFWFRVSDSLWRTDARLNSTSPRTRGAILKNLCLTRKFPVYLLDGHSIL